MKPHLLVILAAVSAGAPERAWAQLVAERFENGERICVYRDNYSPLGGRQYTVGLGEACSAYPPTERSNLSVPPTARLQSSQVKDGKRVCIYAQRYLQWSLEVPLDRWCPMSVGANAAQQSSVQSREE